MMRHLGFVAGNGLRVRANRRAAVCPPRSSSSGGGEGSEMGGDAPPQENGVNRARKLAKEEQMDLNAELLTSAEKQRELLRYMSIRDRLEYIDSQGNLTRTFYNAVILTVVIYVSIVLGGFNLVTGVFSYVNRLFHGGF